MMALCLSSMMIMAQTVSEEAARQKAAQVFGAASAMSKSATPSAADTQPVLSYTATEDNEVYYYAYNNPGGGFVLIGGDE